MKVKSVHKWGSRQWITNEAREGVGDEVIEGILKKKTLVSCREAGYEPTEEPQTAWDSAFWLRRTTGLEVPDWVTDEDWQLRCWVKCLGAAEKIDEEEFYETNEGTPGV